MIHNDQLSQLLTAPVWSVDGGLIGTVTAIHRDAAGTSDLAEVRLGHLRRRRALLPLADANGVRLVVPYSRDDVRDAPERADGNVGDGLRSSVYVHYQ